MCARLGLSKFNRVTHYFQLRACLLFVFTLSNINWVFCQSSEINTDQILRIELVVHVVYSNTTQNISNDQINSQLLVLNQDFNKLNPDTLKTLSIFKGVAASCKIIFSLATHDEMGLATSGITRTATLHGPFANDDIHYSETGGKTAWNTLRYLNIWVCDLADGVYGYGSPPGSAEVKDGVVVDFQAFGSMGTAKSPYNKGRTATHEVGHWLGLIHPWGIQGGCIDDDGIEDTPTQANSSGGCNLSQISCGSLDMVQNFMNQSNDECLTLFTLGQKDKMRNSLIELRSGIINNEIITDSQSDKTFQVRQINNYQIEIRCPQPIDMIYVYSLSGQILNKEVVNGLTEKKIEITNPSNFILVVVTGKSTRYTAKLTWSKF
jgi:hypothetical protein